MSYRRKYCNFKPLFVAQATQKERKEILASPSLQGLAISGDEFLMHSGTKVKGEFISIVPDHNIHWLSDEQKALMQ